jgi:hypothetical protein
VRPLPELTLLPRPFQQLVNGMIEPKMSDRWSIFAVHQWASDLIGAAFTEQSRP